MTLLNAIGGTGKTFPPADVKTKAELHVVVKGDTLSGLATVLAAMSKQPRRVIFEHLLTGNGYSSTKDSINPKTKQSAHKIEIGQVVSYASALKFIETKIGKVKTDKLRAQLNAGKLNLKDEGVPKPIPPDTKDAAKKSAAKNVVTAPANPTLDAQLKALHKKLDDVNMEVKRLTKSNKTLKQVVAGMPDKSAKNRQKAAEADRQREIRQDYKPALYSVIQAFGLWFSPLLAQINIIIRIFRMLLMLMKHWFADPKDRDPKFLQKLGKEGVRLLVDIFSIYGGNVLGMASHQIGALAHTGLDWYNKEHDVFGGAVQAKSNYFRYKLNGGEQSNTNLNLRGNSQAIRKPGHDHAAKDKQSVQVVRLRTQS